MARHATRRWMILTMLALLAAIATAEAEQRHAKVVSPTQGEVLFVEAVSFPDYGADGGWRGSRALGLAHGAPIPGSFAIVFDRGPTVVIEVFIEMHAQYLHALVLYRDGQTPRLFVKQGVGAIFREEPIDPAWTPERLVPEFRGRMS